MLRAFPLLLALTSIVAATSASASEVVTFQNGVDGYDAVDDTYLQNNLGSNGGTSHVLVVRTGDDVFSTRNALIRFRNIVGEDAGQVPAGAEVTSATLTLHTSSSAGDEVTVHRMLNDWDPATFTDDEAGNPGYSVGNPPVQQSYNTLDWVQAGHPDVHDEADPLMSDSLLPGATETPYAVDVTADVQDWVDGVGVNDGWVLLGTTETEVRFHSSDAGGVNETKRPILEVQFAPEPGAGAALLAGVALLTGLPRRRSCRRQR